MTPRSFNWVDPNWNIFRYLGDVSHSISIGFLLYKMLTKRTSQGLSGKTQICHLVVFCTRYLNDNLLTPPVYNIVFKILFIVLSAVIVLLYTKLASPDQRKHDNFRLIFIFVPAALIAAFTTYERTLKAIAWTFSLWVEAVAIFPQLLFMTRIGHLDVLTREYIFFLSIYRIFYLLNWVAVLMKMGKSTLKVLYITGIIQTLVYSDFIYNYIKMWIKGGEFGLLPR
jgi:ER lumen protein retaining receptor